MDRRACPLSDRKRRKEEKNIQFTTDKFINQFGFKLYEGQRKFVEDAIEIIQNGEIGALESPTGTGKTRSVLIAAMHYTRNSQEAPVGVSLENMALLRDLYSRSTRHVIYACRTHTQIEQVIKELSYLNRAGRMSVKGIVLGSRKQTCINERVSAARDINNACRVAVKEKRCVYYNNLNKEGLDGIPAHTEISIEKAVEVGRSCSVCPYFYLKKQAQNASIIALPYSILLKSDFFRENRINKPETVIVVDEAHNLYSAVLDEHTVSISYSGIERMAHLYREYMGKTEGVYKTELLEVYMVIEAVIEYGKKRRSLKEDKSLGENSTGKSRIFNVNRFLIELEIDHINMLDISEIVEKHSLPSRIFPVRRDDVQNENESTLRETGKLCRLLGECEKNSYIMVCTDKITFKNIYPAKYLSHLEGVKSILAVGGTLHPCTDIELLFGRKVVHKSYPAICKNVRVDICTDYLFTYKERAKSLVSAHSLAEEYCKNIPSGGVLLFVQSKDALEKVKEEVKSYLYKESRTHSVLFEGESTLSEYKKRIEKTEKVILVCVMGGNFSEGINFGNDLCRALIVCGMPLPMPTEEVLLIGEHRGREYFIEKGMQTVNQTIGRAVRSMDDYSCVVLLDRRFLKHREKLSPWIYPYINITESKIALAEGIKQLRIWKENEKNRR